MILLGLNLLLIVCASCTLWGVLGDIQPVMPLLPLTIATTTTPQVIRTTKKLDQNENESIFNYPIRLQPIIQVEPLTVTTTTTPQVIHTTKKLEQNENERKKHPMEGEQHHQSNKLKTPKVPPQSDTLRLLNWLSGFVKLKSYTDNSEDESPVKIQNPKINLKKIAENPEPVVVAGNPEPVEDKEIKMSIDENSSDNESGKTIKATETSNFRTRPNGSSEALAQSNTKGGKNSVSNMQTVPIEGIVHKVNKSGSSSILYSSKATFVGDVVPSDSKDAANVVPLDLVPVSDNRPCQTLKTCNVTNNSQDCKYGSVCTGVLILASSLYYYHSVGAFC